MLILKIAPVPNRLVVKYSISECPNVIESFREILPNPYLAGHSGDNRLQEPRPENLFVPHIKKACPETEGEFRDNSPCVKRLFAFAKSLFCFLHLVEFWRVQYTGQVKPCIGFEICRGGIVNSVSEADFQALKRGVKAFG